MRDRIFSSVLLPAPLMPMSASASPRCTSNDTSLQRPELLALDARERVAHAPARSPRRASSARCSRGESCTSCRRLESRWRAALDDIGKLPFGPLEDGRAEHEQRQGDRRADQARYGSGGIGLAGSSDARNATIERGKRIDEIEEPLIAARESATRRTPPGSRTA